MKISSMEGGALVVSVDLGAKQAESTLGLRKAWEQSARSVFKSLNQNGLSATWASAQPAASRILHEIASESPSSEIALLVDASWGRAPLSRWHVVDALSRAMTAVHHAGLHVQTVCEHGPSIQSHLDLFAKHGLTMVRTQQDTPAMAVTASAGQGWMSKVWGGDCKIAAVHHGRFGLMEVGVSHRLPQQSGWLSGRGVTRMLDRAATKLKAVPGVVHLTIDIPELAAAGTQGMTQVQSLLERLQDWSQSAKLPVVTLAGLLHKATARRHLPAQSILRRAA